MENKVVRRLNLAALEKKHGTLEAVAEATGTKAAHLSQIKNGTRGMGDKVARRIEAAIGEGAGWMDLIHSDQAAPQPSPARRKVEDDVFRKLERLWEFLTPATKDELLATAERVAAPRIKAAADVWESMKAKGFASDDRVKEAISNGKQRAK
jgi:plasmid maintenance system antidote protein VapI